MNSNKEPKNKKKKSPICKEIEDFKEANKKF